MKCPKCYKECKDLSYNSSGRDIERGLIYHCEEHGELK